MCLQRHSFTLGQLEEYFREGACTQLHARVFTSRFLHCFPCVTFFLRRYLFNLFCTLRTETFIFDSSYPIFDRAYPCYTALPLTLLPHDMRLPTSLCSYPCFRSILYHLPVLCSVLGPCTVTYVPLFVFQFAVHLHGGSCRFVTSVSPVMSFTTHDTSTPSLCLLSMYARRPLTFYRSHVLSYFLRASHSNSSFRCFRLMVHSPSCCCLRPR